MASIHPLSILRRALLVTAGLLSLAVGTVGIFVPLLPTTVFLLLAAACFVRSSDRLYRWLIENRIFGAYIRNYREHRAMPIGAKWCAITATWLTIPVSAWVVDNTSIRVGLLAVAIGVTIIIARIRTLPPETGTRISVPPTPERNT
jgi:uncharacterized protein